VVAIRSGPLKAEALERLVPIHALPLGVPAPIQGQPVRKVFGRVISGRSLYLLVGGPKVCGLPEPPRMPLAACLADGEANREPVLNLIRASTPRERPRPRALSSIGTNGVSEALAALNRIVPPASERQPVPEAAMPICTEEIQRALPLVLRSAIFARAPRMRQLLHFLVIGITGGVAGEVNASTIAADVFGRDAGSFDPSIDPIVRVQLGRLRGKLNRYYASADCVAALRFDIPIGTCVPRVTWRIPKQSCRHDLVTLQFMAVELIGGTASRSFCRSFNEQLLYELYRVSGECMTVHIAAAKSLQRRLEGSLRVDAGQLRISMRLIDNNSGRLLWAHQLDCPFEHSIRQQEQMAREICAALLPQL
jgi:hypothetical protein